MTLAPIVNPGSAAPRPSLWQSLLGQFRELWPLLPGTLLLLLLFILPLAFMLPTSVMVDGHFTLGVYQAIFSDQYYLAVFARSIWLSLLSTVICVLVGYPTAYYLVRLVSPTWKRFAFVLIIAPLFTSAVIRSMAWIIILGRQGIINNGLISLGIVDVPLRLLYNDVAVVIGLVYILLPFMILSIAAVLEGIDPILEEAAHDLGETAFGAFRRVTFPLSITGVIAGSFLVFALCLSSYVTPALLGGGRGKVVAILIFEQFMRLFNWPLGAALSCLILIVSLVTIYGYTKILTRWTRKSSSVQGGI